MEGAEGGGFRHRVREARMMRDRRGKKGRKKKGGKKGKKRVKVERLKWASAAERRLWFSCF